MTLLMIYFYNYKNDLLTNDIIEIEEISKDLFIKTFQITKLNPNLIVIELFRFIFIRR